MNIKRICLALILILALSLPVSVGAKRRYHHYYRARQIYVIGHYHHPAYLLNWKDISNFRNYRNSFSARNEPYVLPVRITGKVKVGGKTFYKVNSRPKIYRGWVYSGSLSHNSRRGHFYRFTTLIKGVLHSELNRDAPRFLHQMKGRTLFNLNRDRNHHHVANLKENRQLNALAELRAHQLILNFNHYDHNGTPYTTDDALRVGLPADFQASENIASAGIGRNVLKGDPRHYQNRNGYNMADADNNGMMYHDTLEQNGHRYNILDPNSTMVGIGTAYDSKRQVFYLAEDFGNYNPNSSEDVR